MTHSIIVIDPRPTNEKTMIDLLQYHHPVIGIEITHQPFLPYLFRNVDGQHFGDDHNKTAIEIMAYDTPNLPTGLTFALLRPDADAVGAIAAYEILVWDDHTLDDIKDRVDFIAQYDKFAQGEWPGVRPVSLSALQLEFKAISVIASNFKLPIENRVALLKQYLLTGNCDGLQTARDQALASFNAAKDQSKIYVEKGIANIESRHIGATEVGYHYAPVLVIMNDAFRFNGGEPHTKYTICQYEEGHVDMPAIIKDLNEIEISGGTWGGSKTIAGSPQGVSSSVDFLTVSKIVESHLL